LRGPRADGGLVDGDAWIKLRNDDFSDLEEHYIVRDAINDTPRDGPEVVPVLSNALVGIMKSTMKSKPTNRMTLGEMSEVSAMRRLQSMNKEGRLRAALIEEDEGFLREILVET
jgi:mitosis inhibitor protein kinase SWE1